MDSPKSNEEKLKSANGVHGLSAADMVTGVKIEKFLGLVQLVISQDEQWTAWLRK